MNCPTDSLYIVTNLYSSKKEFFPNNTADDFWTKLSKPLLFGTGQWTVALCEIRLANVLLEKKESAKGVLTDDGDGDDADNEPLANGKRKRKKTKSALTDEEKEAYLRVDFEHCEGLIIRGEPTRTLRMIPYEPDRQRVFTDRFYVPVRTGYIDSFQVCVHVESNTPLQIKHSDDTCITCTFHFKKSLMRNHVF